MCVFVLLRKKRFPVDWRLLVKECIANIGIPLDPWTFIFCRFDVFFAFDFFSSVLGSLQTGLLCILGELQGGGYVAVAVTVCISDR